MGCYGCFSAYFMLKKFDKSLSDFRQLAKLAPNNADVISKLKECEKAARYEAFKVCLPHVHTYSQLFLHLQRAIAVDDAPPISQQVTTLLSSMVVPSSDTGPSMATSEWPVPPKQALVTPEVVAALTQAFRDQKRLHIKVGCAPSSIFR